MKLVRYGKPGKEKPGQIDADGKLRDLSAVIEDIGPDQLGDAALARLRKLKTEKLPLVKGSPLDRRLGFLATFLLKEKLISEPADVDDIMDASLISEALKTRKGGQ